MCGINGITWPDRKKIKAMNEAVKHRGPDDEGIFIDDRVSLGHRRLSILDLSEKGKQPMCDETKRFCIVHNGEIYNFREIREQLIKKGFSFRSNTDTEVILKAYIQWGEKALEKFIGMWAFAIYDSKEKKLFLSRDRFGIKPLYYFYDGKKLIFSSEIKGLLASREITAEVNEKSLLQFLAFHLMNWGDETFFKNINQLPAGFYAIFDINQGKLILRKYYDVREKIRFIEGENAHENFKNLLKDAVEKRLVADVPVGSCLSGGLDSSSIVCLMREILGEGKEISAFSLIFPGRGIDESTYQKEVEKKCRVKRYTTTFTEKELLDDLEDLIWTQEEPFETLSIYGQYRVMRLARENATKVLLDGQGSDELMGGYHWLFSYYFLELLGNRYFIQLGREIKLYMKLYHSLGPAKGLLILLLPRNLRLSLYKINEISFLNYEYLTNHQHEIFNLPLKWEQRNFREISIYAETVSSLPQLLRFEDKNSMRWSVESRVPFVDHRVVELLLSLPTREKINNGISKVILRKSMRGVIPDKIRKRIDKIGFQTPDSAILLSDKGKNIAEEIFKSSDFKNHLFWDHRKIIRDYTQFISGNGKYPEYIWKVILTELWFKKWIKN